MNGYRSTRDTTARLVDRGGDGWCKGFLMETVRILVWRDCSG